MSPDQFSLELEAPASPAPALVNVLRRAVEGDDARDVECPTCGARVGTYCRRPSGHKAWSPHAERWTALGVSLELEPAGAPEQVEGQTALEELEPAPVELEEPAAVEELEPCWVVEFDTGRMGEWRVIRAATEELARKQLTRWQRAHVKQISRSRSTREWDRIRQEG